jgi:uncharacterized damage-inducible protein DinB
MKAIDTIRQALHQADQGIRAMEDMKEDPLRRPFPGGNHPMWILGHLTVTEGRLHKVLWGESNPVEHWKPMFDWGTEPKSELSAYPPFNEVLQTYRRLRAKTLAFLDEVGDEGLDRPTKHPIPGLEKSFDTVGKALTTIAFHQCFHDGQASVARRASGKQPVFQPTEELRRF